MDKVYENMMSWKDKLSEAQSLSSMADSALQEALQMLLKAKGVDSEIASDFYACFTSGGETVIHYKADEGCRYELPDLDLTVMAGMCANEFYKYYGIEV